MPYARLITAAIALACVIAFPSISLAYKLAPVGTKMELKVAQRQSGYWDKKMQEAARLGVEHFTEPVHEEITQRIFDCDGEEDVCTDVETNYASPYVLAGVRWNDDPPFRLEAGEGKGTSCNTKETIRYSTQPECWIDLFRDAKKRAKAGKPAVSLLARSHFGDLQFLHAMAEREGEPATITRQRILMWAEFTWRVAMGEFQLAHEMSKVSVSGMDRFFGTSGKTVQDLLVLGNVPLRRRIREFALGSLLHTVQDSFAKGHVDRAEGTNQQCAGNIGPKPGVISEFHSYTGQDAREHAKYDKRNAFSQNWIVEKPDVIDVGRRLVEYYDASAPWDEVRPYIECVFTLSVAPRASSAGNGFADD